VLRSALFVLVVLVTSGPVLAHDENGLDPHNATRGIRLELSESPRVTAGGTYRLRVTGVSRGNMFNLWTQDFGAPFRMVASNLSVDEFGNVVSSRPAKPEPFTVRPGPYPQGAAWSVALVSADRAVRAFAAVIPRPIIPHNGSCMVQLELVSYRGDRFVATGSVFPPGNEVTVESRSAGRVTEKRRTVSSEGRLPLEVIAHEAIGPDDNARYVVKCKSCAVAIEYRWGAGALARRSP